MWALTYKWARYSHPYKPISWVIALYFGPFNPSRRNRRVFGDRHSGAYLPIRLDQDPPTPDGPRHGVTRRPHPGRLLGQTATQAHAPTEQHQPAPPTGTARSLPSCNGLLLHAEREPTSLPDWEQLLTVTRKAVRKTAIIAQRATGTPDDPAALHLLHAHCPAAAHRRHCQAARPTTATRKPIRPLEPGAVKIAPWVLRGPRRSNGQGCPTETARQTDSILL
jgi:RNA-directed DNA polymerase